MANYKIYYCPYAGAFSTTFKKWSKLFGDEFDFIAFDYAGHGDKGEEEFHSTVEEMVEELYELIVEENEEELPYVLAGHCLGGLIACELYYKIVEMGEIELPERIFISGHGAPDKVVDEGLRSMNDEEILNYLNTLGIISDSMIQGEFRRFTEGLYIPPIRADVEVYLNYIWNPNHEKIQVPLTIQYGKKDWKCPVEEIKRWEEFTTEEIHFITYDAEHYFIMEQPEQVVEDMKEDIRKGN